MSTEVALITPEDLLRMGDAGKGHELVDGELREIKMRARSSHVGGEVYRRLGNYCESSPGWAFPPETVVYPSTKQILAYRSDKTTALFEISDRLAAPDLLPGFSCPVADLFRLPGEPAPGSKHPVE